MQPTAMSASASSSATGHGAGGVAEVPLHQGAGLVGGGGEAGQVVHRAGPEVDVGQREQGDVVVEGGGRVGRVAPAQLEVEQSGRPRPRRTRRWGSVVGSRTTTRRPGRSRLAATNVLNSVTVVESPTCTSPGPTPISGAIRSPTRRLRLDPVGGVPRGDQAGAPLVGDHLLQPAAPPSGAARPASCRRGRRRPSGRANSVAAVTQRARLVEGDRVVARRVLGHAAHPTTRGSAELAEPVAGPDQQRVEAGRGHVVARGGRERELGDGVADPHEARAGSAPSACR